MTELLHTNMGNLNNTDEMETSIDDKTEAEANNYTVRSTTITGGTLLNNSDTERNTQNSQNLEGNQTNENNTEIESTQIIDSN